MDKLKIYLDNCCYGRPFDDLSQEKIKNEANAKMFIQSLIQYKSISLYYSFMSLYEISKCPLEENKRHIQNFVISNADTYISKANYDEIEKLSNEIMLTGIKQKDATHLACSIIAKCNYFITTDDRVTKYKTERIKVVNPIDFIKIWRA
jgi:predicted nucleic acid-binding protein